MQIDKPKILVIDDEQDVLTFLRYNLEKAGYVVETASDGLEGIGKANKMHPDLVILDLMMPKTDGMETCLELRKNPQLASTLILFLTARDEDYNQIAAYDSGADDYVVKPVKPRLLVSKVESLLRRQPKQVQEAVTKITYKDIEVDLEKHIALYKDEKLKLTKKEFEILLLLVGKPEKMFSRLEILQHVWGSEVIVLERTVDVHIHKIKKQLKNDFIEGVKGFGYRFEMLES